MKVLIPAKFKFTSIEQHNNTGTMGVRFYLSKDKTQFLIVGVEIDVNEDEKEEVSIGGPYSSALIEPMSVALGDLNSLVRTGRL